MGNSNVGKRYEQQSSLPTGAGFFISGDLMKIIINGKNETVAGNPSLAELCKLKGLPQESTIILINGDIIQKTEWASHIVDEREQIEFLRFVGGG